MVHENQLIGPLNQAHLKKDEGEVHPPTVEFTSALEQLLDGWENQRTSHHVCGHRPPPCGPGFCAQRISVGHL